MRILITGITGQDGSILSDLHRHRGDQVWGTASSFASVHNPNIERIIVDRFEDPKVFNKILDQIMPDRIYHLAAKHHSSTTTTGNGVKLERLMFECHVLVTRNILNWQLSNTTSKSLIALSSQMYEATQRETVISETTPCKPQTYYGQTKLEAMKLLRAYRENFQVNTFGAILFNHTSKRSKKEFLFPSLAKSIAKVVRQETNQISLADHTALIDICHADEVCSGLSKLLDLDNSTDMIFARGQLISISNLILKTMKLLEFNRNYNLESQLEPALHRNFLCGDSSKAANLINWSAKLEPEEILLQQVIEELHL